MERVVSRIMYEIGWALSLNCILLIFAVDWLSFSLKHDVFWMLVAAVWLVRAVHDFGMYFAKQRRLKNVAKSIDSRIQKRIDVGVCSSCVSV